MTLYDLERLELASAPPCGSAKDLVRMVSEGIDGRFLHHVAQNNWVEEE
jgi:hypothetical protein